MTDKHCTEQQLDLYLKSPAQLSADEQSKIRTHVSQCKLCEEQLGTLQRFYADLEERLKKPATERDRAFAERLLFGKRGFLPVRSLVKQASPLLQKIKFDIEPYQPRLPQRIFRYLIIHPVRTIGAASLAVLAIATAFMLIQPNKDINPTHARIKDYVLSVYNKDGEMLWTKSTLGIPDVSSESLFEGKRRLLLVTDIDGNGSNEILLTGPREQQSSFGTDTLYCFNNDGILRWKSGITPVTPTIKSGERQVALHSSWVIMNFFIINSEDASRPKLYTLANDAIYFPSKFSELDPKDGRELQSYLHPGGLTPVLTHDIDLDGKLDIILGGVNNAYQRACIAVLDPIQISGHGPSTPEFRMQQNGNHKEKFYLLFPKTELGQTLASTSYNVVKQFVLNKDGSFIVRVYEFSNIDMYETGSVLYTIIANMKVHGVVPDDNFLKAHERLLQEEKIQKELSETYWEGLKNAVLYWNGGKFVNQPIGNALYFGSQNVP